jgi:hypothetical protein
VLLWTQKQEKDGLPFCKNEKSWTKGQVVP